MKELTWKEREEITDLFGKLVIENVRDRSLAIAMKVAKCTTVNSGKLEQYKLLGRLPQEEKELICDLLSETLADTIFNFLHMFEYHSDIMKLIVTKDGVEYDLVEVSEMLGSEITTDDEDAWIAKFSKIGRFVW